MDRFNEERIEKNKLILESCNNRLVGTYEEGGKGFGFVICDHRNFKDDVFVAKENSKGAVTGHKVIVEVTSLGDETKKPEGKIVEIFGHINDPGMDMMSIVMGMNIPYEFPERVINQAERLAKPVSDVDMVGRTDLRDVCMVTIDSESAKDLDDAVSLSLEGELFHLGVHIADVSNYVQENSAMDREALHRGTSVYLADRVIPMLPHALSNGICSLNEGEDRLSLSCIMDIDVKGNIVDYKIVESVIRVNHRMSYTNVKKIIEDHDEEMRDVYKDITPMLDSMLVLSHILRKKRDKRGAIDFDFPETNVTLDEDGRPIAITAYERNEATRLIEEFMLAANETVAEHFYWQELPFLYRIHEAPDKDKMNQLRVFIKNFGFQLKAGNATTHPKEIQKLIRSIEGTPEEMMLSRITLRSMKQARYSPDCEGHFGLACDYYCHFTSPIRRYPDLQIHRIIKDQLRGRLKETKIEHYREILPEVAKLTSAAERTAQTAERDTVKIKKAQFMEGYLYQVFEGVISGVTNWGIYVELPNTVEGLVHVSRMQGDYYRFNEEAYELVGEGTGKTYRLGDRVSVMVHDIDSTNGLVDFILV